MKDTLTMANSMVKVDTLRMMAHLTMVNGWINKRQALECKCIPMVIHMKVNLKMGNSMEKESLLGLMVNRSQVSGKKDC